MELKHRSRATLALATTLLLAACQTTGPTADTQSETTTEPVTLAHMAGRWVGTWGGKVPTTIEITAEHPYVASYCYDDQCESPTGKLANVRVQDGELRFKWGGTFRWTLDGDTLHGKYRYQGSVSKTAMKRVP